MRPLYLIQMPSNRRLSRLWMELGQSPALGKTEKTSRFYGEALRACRAPGAWNSWFLVGCTQPVACGGVNHDNPSSICFTNIKSPYPDPAPSSAIVTLSTQSGQIQRHYVSVSRIGEERIYLARRRYEPAACSSKSNGREQRFTCQDRELRLVFYTKEPSDPRASFII